MTIAILNGIHANLQALEAVRDDIAATPAIDRVIVLGDLVGYGGDPAAVLELVRDAGWHCLAGNWEYAVALPAWDSVAFNPKANCSRWWTRGALSAEQRAWLAGLPAELHDEAIDCQFVHASPAPDHLQRYVMQVDDASEVMREAKARHVFIGHTNVPMAFVAEGDEFAMQSGAGELDCSRGRQLINVGAVGQPRDGDPRACYAHYDPAQQQLSWRRVDYDCVAAAAAIAAGGLPDILGERLISGR